MPSRRPSPRRSPARRAAGLFALLTLCACGPDGRPAGYAPDGTQQILAAAPATAPDDAQVLAAALPAPDAISPVPAFRGGDAHWRIEIQSVGDLRHEVVLTQGGARMTGTLAYHPVPGIGEGGPFDLHGALHASAGDAPMQVRLRREACIDARGAHAWKVLVDVEGQAPRDGCGDIPM